MRTSRRRTSRARPPWLRRNASKKAAPKFNELTIWDAVGTVRAAKPREMRDTLPPGLAAKFKKLAPGLYKYGYGPKKGETIVKFTNASLKGAMTSTRIGASKVHEYHWVIDNFDPNFPVIIRGIDDRGRSYFRVEEYAKSLVREPVLVKRQSMTKRTSR
jgi:hypothetical protein